MKKTTKPAKCGKVTSLSVSRLYNLGNYQNVKFDLTVQVGPGESASQTFTNVMWIINQLRPLRVPECQESYENAIKLPAETQSEYQKQHLEEWASEMTTWAEKKRRRAEAVAAFDDLGGVSKYTDHKEKWDDEDAPY